MPRFRSLLWGAGLLALAGCQRSASDAELKALQAKLSQPAPKSLRQDGVDRKTWEAVRAFYEARRGQPVWIRRGKPSSDVDDLQGLLSTAADEGLRPDEYGSDRIEQRVQNPKNDAAAMEAELALSAALMRYARHLAFGHPVAKEIDPTWTPTLRELDVPRIVAEAVDDGDLDELPQRLAPRDPEYARLKELLRRERAANPPDAERVRRIELNLERWRWLPEDLGAPHVLVNVPGFELEVREDGESVPLQMRVIVGKEVNRTPIFSDTMTHVVFSPYWNIPQSIEMKEMLPKILEDEDFLDKNEMEVVRKGEVIKASDVDWDELEDEGDIQLRQRPGAENALGYVKFLFPNRHNVYLHDTPNDNLFDKLTRDLSHGCIRVEKPVDLAAYVLKDQPEWTSERIDEAMHAGKEKHVTLKKAIPVHLVYFTVRVPSGGEPQFFDDVYGYDARQAELEGR
jgi:murein L,D-transpeptidase YcbB/YkuD